MLCAMYYALFTILNYCRLRMDCSPCTPGNGSPSGSARMRRPVSPAGFYLHVYTYIYIYIYIVFTAMFVIMFVCFYKLFLFA